MVKELNLFDKYGGVPTIKKILEEFYKDLLSRTWAKNKFKGVDMDKLLLHQIQFVSFAMGKPESEFDDERLRKGHAGLDITEEQYEETIAIIIRVLTNFKVKYDDIKLIGDAIESKKHLIVKVPLTNKVNNNTNEIKIGKFKVVK